MKVKVCGITRVEDLKACEENNVDFVGFINIKRSKRFIDLNSIVKLVNEVRNPEKAVLVIEPGGLEEAIELIEKSNIKNIQLHSLLVDDIIRLRRSLGQLMIFRVVGIPGQIDMQKKFEIEAYAKVCDFLLFDSEVKGKSGGTGKQIPLKLAGKAAAIAKTANNNIKLLLAGGLDFDRIKNDGEVIGESFGYIDVNSGVEDKPGFKDIEKIKEIIQLVSE